MKKYLILFLVLTTMYGCHEQVFCNQKAHGSKVLNGKYYLKFYTTYYSKIDTFVEVSKREYDIFKDGKEEVSCPPDD